MNARYFRYLFENTNNGIIQSGCLYDSIRDERTFFLYMCGVQHGKPVIDEAPKRIESEIRQGEDLYLFVLADYTVSYIKYLIGLLRRRRIQHVVIPYLAALRRFSMAIWLSEKGEKDMELYRFLENPYQYLQDAGVENIHYVYGNGTPLKSVKNLQRGMYFEPAGEDVQKMVELFEGTKVPIEKAGCLVENQWVFYFGAFGNDLKKILQMIQRYCTKEEYYTIMRNPKKYLHSPILRRLLYAYGNNFGAVPKATVTMFQGPLRSEPDQIDSLLSTKVFTREQRCCVGIPCEEKTCALKCLYLNDYDLLKKHKDRNAEDSKFGVMLLGNTNLMANYEKICARYSVVRNQVRAISVPNGGVEDNWNDQILNEYMGQDIKYWVCPTSHYTDSDLIKNILMKNSFYRLVNVNEKYGYCFSGYIIPSAED